VLGAGGGHGAAGVGGAGVEVEVVFGLCDGGGGGGGRVHEGLGDLGEGEVLVGGEEVLDAGDEGVEVGGVDTVLEPVRQPVADAAEAAEELGAGGGGRGRLGGGRGHHCHAGHFANPGRGRGGGGDTYCFTYARAVTSAPALVKASSNRSISALETSCSVLKNQMMNSRSLSSGSLPFASSFNSSKIWPFVCFVMFSSIWKKLSSCRSLMLFNSAVAMFMCISRMAFLSRSSGSNVIAAFRCWADALVSFCRSSREEAPVFLVTSFASSL